MTKKVCAKCYRDKICQEGSGTEWFEILLAEVIDRQYLKYRDDICDYDNKTHTLGRFKESIKLEMADRLEALKRSFEDV